MWTNSCKAYKWATSLVIFSAGEDLFVWRAPSHHRHPSSKGHTKYRKYVTIIKDVTAHICYKAVYRAPGLWETKRAILDIGYWLYSKQASSFKCPTCSFLRKLITSHEWRRLLMEEEIWIYHFWLADGGANLNISFLIGWSLNSVDKKDFALGLHFKKQLSHILLISW